MTKMIRTNSSHPDFIALVRLLDADLAEKDGNDHSFYAQFNKIDKIGHVVGAYEGDKAVACGAIKEFTPDAMEVKRMYTLPEHRGKGIASKVLKELETWVTELSFTTCVLETGIRQPDAIRLYKKNGYDITPNYGQYIGVENSVCFKKKLPPV